MDCKYFPAVLAVADLVFSCSRPIIDQQGRVVAGLVGQPKDPSYTAAADAAFLSILKEGEAASFHPEETLHYRGAFPAINVRVMHGKGTKAPVYLNNHHHGSMMDRLLADANVQRLATFASSESKFLTRPVLL